MFFVSGATGNVGRNVVAQLVAAGVAVRALTRHPATANLPESVEVVGGDLLQPEAFGPALEGITGVFLMTVPGSVEPFLTAAKQHGVRRVVLLSSASVGDDGAHMNAIGVRHKAVERAIEESGLEWAFVRPASFAVNALQWSSQIRAGGVVRGPYAEATSTPIHERDIAAVAVHALLEGGHMRAKYMLTGPESLTQAEQVRLIGEAIGRDVQFEEIPVEIARQTMLQRAPEGVVNSLLDYQAKSVGHP
ncbi:MAG: NAD(P)H-binding protein, partial [Herpetosiphonaceae bacterium]|nr:NAD(P)H-binding protein [Herpetosiphonaceae bacterium]